MGERIEEFAYLGGGKDRLDTFLTSCLPDLSRARIQGLIKDGCVSVDGDLAIKPGRNLAPKEKVAVRIPAPVPSDLIPESIPLDILFENNDLLVINKPAGMVVHPSPGHEAGTLVHATLGHVPDLPGIGGEKRPGIVHRLDKETSGLILVAKNEQALRWLQEQFKSRKVEKSYLALVDGSPPTAQGRIEAPIGRNSVHRKSMKVFPMGKGREATSEYRTLESFPNHTFLEVHPLTGRTHQIRVHLAFLGCPVTGDTMYGKKKPTLKIQRTFLHAHRLKVTLPGESSPTTFEAGLPVELMKILDELRSLKEH